MQRDLAHERVAILGRRTGDQVIECFARALLGGDTAATLRYPPPRGHGVQGGQAGLVPLQALTHGRRVGQPAQGAACLHAQLETQAADASGQLVRRHEVGACIVPAPETTCCVPHAIGSH